MTVFIYCRVLLSQDHLFIVVVWLLRITLNTVAKDPLDGVIRYALWSLRSARVPRTRQAVRLRTGKGLERRRGDQRLCAVGNFIGELMPSDTQR